MPPTFLYWIITFFSLFLIVSTSLSLCKLKQFLKNKTINQYNQNVLKEAHNQISTPLNLKIHTSSFFYHIISETEQFNSDLYLLIFQNLNNEKKYSKLKEKYSLAEISDFLANVNLQIFNEEITVLLENNKHKTYLDTLIKCFSKISK